MYTLTALLSGACLIAIIFAVQLELWWVLPLLMFGSIFFFCAADDADD